MQTYNEYYIALGKNIRALRKSKKLTQTKISEMIGIAQTVYTRKEKGHIKFYIHELDKLAKILSVPLAYFLPRNIK